MHRGVRAAAVTRSCHPGEWLRTLMTSQHSGGFYHIHVTGRRSVKNSGQPSKVLVYVGSLTLINSYCGQGPLLAAPSRAFQANTLFARRLCWYVFCVTCTTSIGHVRANIMEVNWIYLTFTLECMLIVGELGGQGRLHSRGERGREEKEGVRGGGSQ